MKLSRCRSLVIHVVQLRSAAARQTRLVAAHCNSPVGWIQMPRLESGQHQLTVIAIVDEVVAARSRVDNEWTAGC